MCMSISESMTERALYNKCGQCCTLHTDTHSLCAPFHSYLVSSGRYLRRVARANFANKTCLSYLQSIVLSRSVFYILMIIFFSRLYNIIVILYHLSITIHNYDRNYNRHIIH